MFFCVLYRIIDIESTVVTCHYVDSIQELVKQIKGYEKENFLCCSGKEATKDELGLMAKRLNKDGVYVYIKIDGL